MSKSSWVNALSDYTSKPLTPNEEIIGEQSNFIMSSSTKRRKIAPHPIPKFFHPNTAPNECLAAFNEITRELFLDNTDDMLLSERDLDQIYTQMTELCADNNNQNCFMNYEIFKALKHNLPKRAHKFFTAAVFRKFPLNSEGAIRGISFHQFVSFSSNLLHQFITLCRYDILSNKNGFLTEADLEMFIGDQIEMIPTLQQIDEAFHPYYIYHAVRKFMYCLNPDNSKKHLSITRILCSQAFREFNEFRFCAQQKQGMMENKQSSNNWFSCQSALRVYKMYLTLDGDHNGTLSKKEMLQFNQSSLSNLTIQRIFQYKKTWDQEMDYKGFLDFVLATECKKCISSLHYFWEILDLDGVGYLTPLTIHTLFRSVQKKLGIFGIDPIDPMDMLSEIIDMVHPKDETKITKQDLINSKMAGTVIDILTDVKGFWEYDNRESLIAQQNQEQQ